MEQGTTSDNSTGPPSKGPAANDSTLNRTNDVFNPEGRSENAFTNKNISLGTSETEPNITDEPVDKYKGDELAKGDTTLAAEGDGENQRKLGGLQEDDGLPIDRGWAWVVLAGSFLNVILMVGYARSIGILFVEYLKIFEASAAETTLFMGVMAATFSLSSLFSMNLILHVIGVRATVLIGGVIASIGMLTAVFAASITFLTFTHSILLGIGQPMIHGPSLVLIGQYFKKRRSLATAISMSGVSLGGSIFPPLVRYFVDEFGVRGSMLLLTGMTMNILVGGLLYRPLESFRKRVVRKGNPVDKVKSLEEEYNRPSRVSMAITHPVLGSIRDLSGSYEICFNYIGACNYVAAFCLLCEPLVRWRAKRLNMLTDQ